MSRSTCTSVHFLVEPRDTFVGVYWNIFDWHEATTTEDHWMLKVYFVFFTLVIRIVWVRVRWTIHEHIEKGE